MFIFVAVKTVRLTGNTAPVDSECTEMIGKAQVYKEGSDIYDAMLNQVKKKHRGIVIWLCHK